MKICKFLLFFAEFELNLSLNFAFIKLNFVLIQPYRARKVTTPSSNALKFSLNHTFSPQNTLVIIISATRTMSVAEKRCKSAARVARTLRSISPPSIYRHIFANSMTITKATMSANLAFRGATLSKKGGKSATKAAQLLGLLRQLVKP